MFNLRCNTVLNKASITVQLAKFIIENMTFYKELGLKITHVSLYKQTPAFSGGLIIK